MLQNRVIACISDAGGKSGQHRATHYLTGRSPARGNRQCHRKLPPCVPLVRRASPAEALAKEGKGEKVV